jgi:hypothetical protein
LAGAEDSQNVATEIINVQPHCSQLYRPRSSSTMILRDLNLSDIDA